MGPLNPSVIPPEIIAVCQRLRDGGFRAYLVGGAVRDHLRLQEEPAHAKDFDVTTSARPEDVIRIFGKKHTVPTGLQHGTVTVLTAMAPRQGPPHQAPGPAGHREHVEVTTFRGEGAYSDGRRPDQVAFIDDLTEDLRRRDFTINAMAYDPVEDRLIDPFDGQGDLGRRVLRAVGDAAARFGEDGLRTMRAVRFAAQLGFALDPATEAAIPGALPTFRKVSAERVRDELLKLLKAAHAVVGLRLMRGCGLLAEVLPELCAAAALETAMMDRVFSVVEKLPADPVLRLGGLLAPLGQGVEPVLWRLKLSSAERERLVALCGAEALDYEQGEVWTGAALRRFLARTGPDLLEDVLALRGAQAEAAGNSGAVAAVAALLRRTQDEIAARPPLRTGDLALSGKDVMGLLGIAPGPAVGQILAAALEAVLEDPARNTREGLSALLPALAAAVAAR